MDLENNITVKYGMIICKICSSTTTSIVNIAVSRKVPQGLKQAAKDN